MASQWQLLGVDHTLNSTKLTGVSFFFDSCYLQVLEDDMGDVLSISGLLKLDGFDAAFIGAATRFGFDEPVAAYDLDKCLAILMKRDGMSHEGAREFFQFNIIGAWVGEQTPIFVTVGV